MVSTVPSCQSIPKISAPGLELLLRLGQSRSRGQSRQVLESLRRSESLKSHAFSDCIKLNVRGALVNGADFGVSVEFFDGIVFGESDAAHPVDAFGGDLPGEF